MLLVAIVLAGQLLVIVVGNFAHFLLDVAYDFGLTEWVRGSNSNLPKLGRQVTRSAAPARAGESASSHYDQFFEVHVAAQTLRRLARLSTDRVPAQPRTLLLHQ